jgi:alpha-1,2-mannosyltransferase
MRKAFASFGGWKLTLVVGAPLIVIVVLGTLLLKAERLDLEILLRAAHNLRLGQEVYRLEDYAEHTKPPLVTFLLIPLTHLPLSIVRVAWDLLNVAVLLLMATRLPALGSGEQAKRPAWALPLLGILFVLNNWNAELLLGQYNLLLLGALLLLSNELLAGLGVFFALALKPTNLIFLPWALRQHACPRRVFAAALGWGALAACGYLLFRGPRGLLEDHLQWLGFLGDSTFKHLFRADNYGIPSFLARLGFESRALPFSFMLLATGLSTWLALRSRDALEGLALTALLAVALSPMSWNQNYCLMLPLALALTRRWLDKREAGWILVALVLLYVGTQIYNPTIFGMTLYRELNELRIPLWTSLAAGLPLALRVFAEARVSPKPQARKKSFK